MKTLLSASLLSAFILLLIPDKIQAQKEHQRLKRLPLVNLKIPEIRFDRKPLADAALELQAAANLAKKGGNPITIEYQRNPLRPNPIVTSHIIGQSLDTVLQLVTEQAGFDWKIEDKKIVIFTSRALIERDTLSKAHPGRTALQAIRIPKLEFADTPITEALKTLEAEAKKRGLRRLLPVKEDWSIKVRFSIDGGGSLTVSGSFVDTDVDTILEILTKQTAELDWSIEEGHVIVITRDQALALAGEGAANKRFHNSFGPIDPFAPAGGGGGAVDAFAPAGASPSVRRSVRRLPDGTVRIAPPDPGDENPLSAESYQDLRDNPFLSPRNEPLSTFSIDVDTASYANIRRYILHMGETPPVGSVRIEEMVNYFEYSYASPPEIEKPERPELPVEHPFATHVEVTGTPWKKDHRLVKIGLKGYEYPLEKRPASNLVFLLDVSGSMSDVNKLPLVKRSMDLLLKGLTAKDRVAIVVYAGASGLALESTLGTEVAKIREAINALASGGSTNAGEGIELAYKVAEENLIPDGNNRVILCTDGDFNVGITDQTSLRKTLELKAKKGIQLTILGFGMGNYKDDMLETLSNFGDGNYGYIDSFREAKKLFVQRLLGTLIMIAKDVKIQVEFNPRKVAAYRLIGYENRLLENQDFEDDEVDAGDIGSGHTVTALYEIVPPGVAVPDQPGEIDLRYQKPELIADGEKAAGELLTVKLRYKWPGTDTSRLIETPVVDNGTDFAKASGDLKFASAVAGFGMLLRQSPHSGEFAYEDAFEIARANVGADPFDERKEFVEVVRQFVW